MATDTTPIEISNNPELLRLAEEVEATNKPRLLKRDNVPFALLSPVKRNQSSQAKSKAIHQKHRRGEYRPLKRPLQRLFSYHQSKERSEEQ